MKTVTIASISAVVLVACTFLVMNTQLRKAHRTADLEILQSAERTVQKQLTEVSARIQRQLAALSGVIAAQNEFSLRLLVENDRSAPYITEMASRFLKPMDFSVLDIVDSSYTIISSGHFPASAGNSCAAKAHSVAATATAFTDNIRSVPTLTYQVRTTFSIAGFTFHVIGGQIIDTAFLRRLTPHQGVSLLLKHGNEYLGEKETTSISELADNHIIINDRKYLATAIPIPSAGDKKNLTLYILIDR